METKDKKHAKIWALICGALLVVGSIGLAGCPDDDDDDDGIFDKAQVEQVDAASIRA